MNSNNPKNTISIHRVLRASPERAFRAFSNPHALVKWMPPHGFTGTVHHHDFKIDGTYQMSFTNFNTGHRISFNGHFLQIIPNELLRYSNNFNDPNVHGTMITTVTFKSVFCGVEIDITQEDVPATIPLAACYLGWQESLSLLALLTEPEIPDQA